MERNLYNVKSHQRLIREELAAADPFQQPFRDLADFVVLPISKEMAKTIILKYEWLGTMGRAYASYGLFKGDELLGAINFGVPSSHESRNICGNTLSLKSICLERGACSHLAPPNAASFFISRAVKLARSEHGWEIFYAYSDPEAGEVGTVYQACNWFYIGQGVGRDPGRKREYFVAPDGEIISERTLRRRRLKKVSLVEAGWTIVYKFPKHKYVWFEGSRSRKAFLKRKCRYSFKDFPKRHTAIEISLKTQKN